MPTDIPPTLPIDLRRKQLTDFMAANMSLSPAQAAEFMVHLDAYLRWSIQAKVTRILAK